MTEQMYNSIMAKIQKEKNLNFFMEYEKYCHT